MALTFFLALLLYFQTLYADVALQNQPIQITSQRAPDSFVNGSVNTIDGSFSYAFRHLTVPGHVPLDVVQYYNSKSDYSSWLGRGMSLNYSFWIAGKTDDENNTHAHALMEGPGGAIIHCRARNRWLRYAQFFLDPKVIKKGLTNLGSGHISARTNLKNIRVDYKIDNGLAKWKAYLADGTMREYYRTDNFSTAINLRKETRPNKTRLDFHYYKYHEKEGMPRKIEAHGNDLTFDINSEHRYGKISGSNGKEAKFHYFNWRDHDYINEIRSSDQPTVAFHYQRVHDSLCIDRISWPKGRFLEVEYDSKGRVKCQKAPVGRDGEKRTIYSFEYRDNYTKVRDAYSRKTIHRHKRERLSALEEHGKGNRPYRIHKYFWGRIRNLNPGKHPTSDDGNLISEVLLDGQNKAHSAHHFTYDKWGNVTVETLYGNLSGAGELSKISPVGTPVSSSVERYKKKYRYSSDRLHLPVYEWHENGLTYKYRYEHDTDLMSAKFTIQNDTILIREFYSYNKEGILVQKTIDNGTDPHKNILEGVTEQHIQTIVPVKNGHGQGLPKSISESYLDLGAKVPVLLKRQEFSYNKAGQVIAEEVFDVENQHRYTLKTKYNDKGCVVWKTDELGHEFEYDYDDNCNKTYEKKVGCGFYTTYKYDKSNRLTVVEEHHDDGTLVRTSCEYDLMGNKVSSTDRYGQTTYYEYDDFNRVKKITLPSNNTICKEYDIFDNVIAETDQNGHTTRFEYTARQKRCKSIYADGSEERCLYNLDGTLAHAWDKSGTKTSYAYDVLGRVTEVSVFDRSNMLLSKVTNRYNAFHLLSTTDPMGYTTTYSYDGAGRKVAECKEGSTTTFAYDTLGRLSCTKNYLNANEYIEHHTEYDLLGRVILKKKMNCQGHCMSWVAYAYDTAGNCILSKTSYHDGDDVTVSSRYNSQRELCCVTDELGSKTLTFMDHNARKKTAVDALGNTTEEHFDILGRIAAIYKKNSQGSVLSQTDFTYNGTGKKVKQVEHVYNDFVKSHEYIISWEYDALDRITSVREVDDKVTRYSYDMAGRIAEIIKPDGVILTHSYDALGRMTSLVSSDNTVHYTYSYDLHNNPVVVHDHVNHLTTVQSYDAWDRCTSDGLQGVFTQSFAYDPLGRLTDICAPDGSQTSYRYLNGYLKEVQRGEHTHHYESFDLQERVLKSTQGEFFWDKKGRQTKISSPSYALTIPAEGFDAVGNLRTLDYQDPVGSVTFRASYDDLYHLTEESGTKSHSYNSDSIGNRRKKDAIEHTINPANKLMSDGKSSFAYDKNGNLINDGTSVYSYDALDRLTSVTSHDETTHYIYDSMHRRVARKGPDGKTECFLYLGLREIGLLNSARELVEYRVLGLGKGAELGASVLIELYGAQYIPVHDNRGAIVCLIDPVSHAPKETYRYTAFGEREVYDESRVSIDKSAVGNPWGFSSKRLDLETGFVYFHRRYYAPELGRWITPDPLGFADGPNLYAYVHNNPMTRFDLYGLLEEDLQECSEKETSPSASKNKKFSEFLFSRSRWEKAGIEKIPGVDIVAVNGVWNSPSDAGENFSMVSSAGGGVALHGLYNASYYLTDPIEAACQVHLRVLSQPTLMLANYLTWYHETQPEDHKTLLIGHSQGTAVVRNALLMCKQHVQQRAIVVAIAPSAIVSNEICSKADNYISTGDPIGKYTDMLGIKNNPDNVHFLEPHPDACQWFDHSFASPTYREKITEHMNEYIERYRTDKPKVSSQ